MERALTYVYCLVAAPRKPNVKGVAPGLPGLGPVQLLELERGRWLVVADAPANRFGEQIVNRKLADLDWVARAAIAHERVVESFITLPAALPMKLFTIFLNDERAVADVSRDRRRIDRLLKHVANQHEWGVRVQLDRAQALRARLRPKKTAVRSGADYLVAKQTQRAVAVEMAEHAREAVATVYDRCAALARSSKRRMAEELPIDGGPLLLDAAFLVPRSRSTRLRALVKRQALRLQPQGYRIALTGPWPPYSFVQD